MDQASFVRPPRVAAWLIGLFLPDKLAESIPGDLLEEFSDLASKSGVAFARRWYWRQSVKTVAHLIRSGFRSAPWQIASAVLIGRWLLFHGLMLPEQVIVAMALRYPDHSYHAHEIVHELWMFWVPLATQIGWVILAMCVGCFVAIVVKGREIIATMTLGLSLVAPPLVRAIVHRQGTPFSGPPSLRIAMFLVFPIAFGGIVRKIRSAVSAQRSSSHC